MRREKKKYVCCSGNKYMLCVCVCVLVFGYPSITLEKEKSFRNIFDIKRDKNTIYIHPSRTHTSMVISPLFHYVAPKGMLFSDRKIHLRSKWLKFPFLMDIANVATNMPCISWNWSLYFQDNYRNMCPKWDLATKLSDSRNKKGRKTLVV